MQAVVVILALVAFTSASPLMGCRQAVRQSSPEDNDPLRVKHILYEDEQGKLHFEDLTESCVEIRAKIEHVTIYLYTRKNENNAVTLKVNDLSDLINSKVYKPKKHNYFIIHGWKNDGSSDVNRILKPAILERADVNVFVVDWGVVANHNYVTARNSITDVAEYLGDFINLMIENYTLPTSSISMAGHSLGAHIAGLAGNAILRKHGLINFIVGLDPAGPLFTVRNTKNRLHTSNAEHVQAIHTSGSLLGWTTDLGHSDFYPNGGKSQPGCGLDPIGTCAHSHSYLLYEESIRMGGFISYECDSYKNYNKGKCNDRPQSYFGGLNVDKSACGNYFFDTNKKSPYSQS